MLDVDNDHSDDPKDWTEPLDVALAFPDVCFAVHYSRNHMKEKNGRAARPKFHVLLPIEPMTNAECYCETKRAACEVFPFFDINALDAGRCFFGTPEAEVEFYNGSKTLAEFLGERNVGEAVDSGTSLCFSVDDYDADDDDADTDIVPQGQRNTHMSQYAARILVRLGDTEEAHRQYLREARKCTPPLSEKELDATWQSARRFYHEKVVNQPGYIPPAQFIQQASAPFPTSSSISNSSSIPPSSMPNGNVTSAPNLALRPKDYSDLGQATVLANVYGSMLRYSPATDYITYNGTVWIESKSQAQGIAHKLTERQLEEAEAEVQRHKLELVKNGAWAILESCDRKKALAVLSPDQRKSFDEYEQANEYKAFVIKRRDTKYISAALKEARPMVEIDPEVLDANGFLLNTPSATFDLRTGVAREHRDSDYITQQTAIDPSDEGSDFWDDALDVFFQGDTALISYVQEVAGLVAIGKVYVEGIIISVGDGCNGKSTYWNTLARVLGSYAGSMSADMLTVGCRRNVKPELAAARGKRLLIAAELEEGMRLNTATVKTLASTDKIQAEPKYRDPFSFTPTHTLVLYTNHLPKVGAIDAGTWRRIIVIPFNARIESNADVKNYSDFLFDAAGGAVLRWIIEGAKRVISNNFKITLPPVVQAAIQQYRDSNDWLAHFLDEMCDVDKAFEEHSGDTYTAYREYCSRYGEYTRNTTDFYSALEAQGFTRYKKKSGRMIKGLRLKSEFSSTEC